MPKEPKLGPVGKGFVSEVKTKEGTRYVARWNVFVMRDGVRVKSSGGPYELGPKVHSGPGLKSLASAKKKWEGIAAGVLTELYPKISTATQKEVEAFAKMAVKDFISHVYEPRRRSGWEENSRLNWEYYRDSFLLPFFGKLSLEDMNSEPAIKAFMNEVAAHRYSEHTARKAFTYIKSILDTARDLGVTRGNAARLIPKTQRLPRGVTTSKSQGHVTLDQFVALLRQISKPRDKIILKILFLCAVRRSELFCLKWKDFVEQDGRYTLTIERSFCSRTHRIKEWSGKQSGGRGKAPAQVAVPPKLAADILGWARYGDTDSSDPEGYIFPTRNDTCIIPTNWIDDVLKPAGKKLGIPEIAYHWFRRGHATVQHHLSVPDKSIQGQLRHAKDGTTRDIYMQQVAPATFKAVVELEKLICAADEQSE